MSLTTIVQEWLKGAGGRGAAALTARRHIAAETGADVHAICATVSADPFFAVPARTTAGHELVPGAVLTRGDEVHAYYEGRSGSYVVRSSAQLTSIATDWYVFNETVATLLGTGIVDGVDASGREWQVQSAVLFPTSADGIAGEICITRRPMGDVIREIEGGAGGPAAAGAAPAGVGSAVGVGSAAVSGGLLDRLSTAARAGDWDAVGAALSPSHSLAIRTGAGAVRTATGREASAAAFVALFAGADDLGVLVRVATDWYAFAEYVATLTGGGWRRLAVIHAVDDGQVSGSFGYGGSFSS